MIEKAPSDEDAEIACDQGDASTLSRYLRLRCDPSPLVIDAIRMALLAGMEKSYAHEMRPTPNDPIKLYLVVEMAWAKEQEPDLFLRLVPRGSGRLSKDAPSLLQETISLIMRLGAPERGNDRELMPALAGMLTAVGRSKTRLEFHRNRRGAPQSEIGIMLNQEYMIDLGRRVQEMIDAGEPMYDGRKKLRSKLIHDQLGVSLSTAEKALKAYRRRQQK